jgi:glutathione S-transferase
MQLQLVSQPMCPYVHRATALLHEKAIPFEVTYVDLTAKPAWFLELSPRGKVPMLVVDGTPLFESAPILEFLDETHPPRTMPDDPLERARHRGWFEVANDAFATLREITTAPTSDAVADKRVAFVGVMNRFEQALRGPYFAGGTPGLVDFAVAPAFVRARLVDRWFGLAMFESTPRVATWAADLATRSSVVQGVPPDFAERYRVVLAERAGYLGRLNIPHVMIEP